MKFYTLKCYSENNLKDIFSLEDTITKSEFNQLCASLVLMRTKEACTFEHDHSDHEHEKCISLSDSKYIETLIAN